jgi:hypothetical protein
VGSHHVSQPSARHPQGRLLGQLSRKSQIFFKQAHNVSEKLDRGAASVDVTRKPDGPANARVQLGSNITDSVMLNP